MKSRSRDGFAAKGLIRVIVESNYFRTFGSSENLNALTLGLELSIQFIAAQITRTSHIKVIKNRISPHRHSYFRRIPDHSTTQNATINPFTLKLQNIFISYLNCKFQFNWTEKKTNKQRNTGQNFGSFDFYIMLGH